MWRLHDVCVFQEAGQVTNTHTGEPEGEPSWADDDRTDTPNVPCSIQPRASMEGPGGAVVVSGWIGVFFPTPAPTHETRIFWRGRYLQVDGDVAPGVFNNAVHHLEVPLKAWSAA